MTREGFVVESAPSGEVGLAMARTRPPDLVILEVLLPSIDGHEVLRQLRAAEPLLPVLVLSARGGDGDQVQALAAGADDYVVKPFNVSVLAARVRRLLWRSTGGGRGTQFRDLFLDSGTRRAQRSGRAIDLTGIEYRLLQLFLSNPRRVLPRGQLIDSIWGHDFSGSVNVLEVYMSQLRRKLEAGGEPRLLHTVRGSGYILREP
jgi:two-component system response regulator MprA